MAKSSLPDFDRASATFRADHLYALEPFIRASQSNVFRFAISGLMIEPVEDGGAVLVATDGHTLAAIYDPQARASRAMRLTIPDETFKAVAPPAPVRMWGEGETYEIPLPEWAQPKVIYAWGLSIFVHPAMPLPGEDPDASPILSSISVEEGNTYAGGYRLHPEPPTLDWRKIFRKERGKGVGTFAANPLALAQFERIGALYRDALRLTLGEPNEPAILTSEDETFVGAMMPVKELGTAPVPAWALASIPATPGA